MFLTNSPSMKTKDFASPAGTGCAADWKEVVDALTSRSLLKAYVVEELFLDPNGAIFADEFQRGWRCGAPPPTTSNTFSGPHLRREVCVSPGTTNAQQWLAQFLSYLRLIWPGGRLSTQKVRAGLLRPLPSGEARMKNCQREA